MPAPMRELGVKQVIVPLGNCAAVWSALGPMPAASFTFTTAMN